MAAIKITPVHPAVVRVSQILQAAVAHPVVQVRLVAVPL